MIVGQNQRNWFGFSQIIVSLRFAGCSVRPVCSLFHLYMAQG